jgi:hypothetical protein
MPEETGESEPITDNCNTEDQRLLYYDAALWTLGFATITFIGLRMWDTDEIRLHVLHAIVQILQAFARVIGLWALEFEKAYNDYADTLH